jgi:hypothetical protein
MGEIQDIDYVAFCGGLVPDWKATGLVETGDATRIHAKVCKPITLSIRVTHIYTIYRTSRL